MIVGIVVFSTICIIIFNLIVDMRTRRRPEGQAGLMALLEVRDLRTSFRTDDGVVQAVDGVNFSVEKGKTLGIVGESGCGKSVTCLTIMGLNNPRYTTSTGEALLDGENLLADEPSSKLRELRGNDIAMIFQDPMTSLNPVKSIGWQLDEAVLLHRDVSKKEARQRAVELLKAVGIPRPERRIDDYPHQFSGGMRQRVMIAMAMINEPDLLIADEPTTALDVTTQAQILKLMHDLQRGVRHCDRDDHPRSRRRRRDRRRRLRHVRRAGWRRKGPVDAIFTRPHHPYTWGLLGSLPRLDADMERLVQIPGQPPSLLTPPNGCRFHPRCPYVMDVCRHGRAAAASRSRATPRTCRRATSTRRRRIAKSRNCSPACSPRWNRIVPT